MLREQLQLSLKLMAHRILSQSERTIPVRVLRVDGKHATLEGEGLAGRVDIVVTITELHLVYDTKVWSELGRSKGSKARTYCHR
jgi:hypothetical protein